MTELKDKLTEAANVLKVIEKFKPKVEGTKIEVIVSFDGEADIRLFEDEDGYGMVLY
jgi:hypothetical protein